MKKIGVYIFLMLSVIIMLPLFIVKSCSHTPGEVPQNQKKGIVQQSGTTVKVFFKAENRTREVPLEEYLKGVVAAEMPAEFDLEALKAQAVAARTYTLARMLQRSEKMGASQEKGNEGVHPDADICTDSTHCQAWASKDRVMKKWGVFKALRYWNKIEKAVNETRGIILVYNGSIVNAVFHSNSGGKTENSEDVWDGVEVPYLKSVVSPGEENTPEFISVVNLKISDFTDKLKEEYPGFKLNGKDVLKNIKILNYTAGGRVKTVKIGNITLKGTDVRKIFSLRSANFKIEKAGDNTLKITVRGNGHGVGMSQWGANGLAKNGGTYDEILKYYYTGVELTTISEFLSKK